MYFLGNIFDKQLKSNGKQTKWRRIYDDAGSGVEGHWNLIC